MAAKLARFSWVPGGLAAAVLIAFGRLLSSTTSSAPLELAVYDRVLRRSETPPTKDVVLVTIDDASIAKLGEWPWPRDVHANLLDRLRADGARVVAFTTAFDTSQRTSEQEKLRAALALLESSNVGNSPQAQQLRKLLGDSATGSDPNAHLAQAMAAHRNVILPVELRVGENASAAVDLPARFLARGEGTAVRDALTAAVAQSPAQIFTDAASGVGHTHLEPDSDERVRADVAAIRVGNVLVPSLGTAIAARAMGLDAGDLTFSADGTLNILGRSILTEDELRIRPRYYPPSGVQSFDQYSYWQVLAGEIPREKLRDKIVVIGFMNTGAAASSAVNTAVSNDAPALVATASTASSLVTGTIYSRPTFALALEWLAAVLVIAFAAFALPATGVAIGALASALVIVILVVTEIGLLSSMHVWVRLMLPCAAVVAGFGLYVVSELLRRANVKNESVKDASGNLRTLGQTFQRQGQLDLAFETYQRCPLDAPTMELLYYLGMDFERRAQLTKAAAVYGYIARRDPNYRDLRNRRARVREEPLTRAPASKPAPAAPTVPPRRRIERDVPDDPFTAPHPITQTPSQALGRYEIERELGKGAMGVVYLGRDPKINRVVAIKAIPLAEEFEEEDLAEARARFFREAEMAGRLNHPAIVTVYDAGEDQGLAYIAMEYLRGQHMSHYTDANRLLPYKNVMWLASRICEALHYAHRQNVIHRDIKPANIMFNPDTDELKITDFGIARLTDTSRTKTGIVLGTPSFMSPEQLEGRPIDGRSDQFALGVSLYQLLCGQLPFRAESMPRLMQKIAMEPHASVRVLRPELPECIDPIIDRVLSKSADDRYQNCGELAAALRTCAGPLEASRSDESKHEWLIP